MQDFLRLRDSFGQTQEPPAVEKKEACPIPQPARHA